MIPWLLFWLDCSLVFVQLRAEGVVVMVLSSHWGWLLFSLILGELVHCLVHTCWAQIPIVKMSPQNCSCRKLALVVLSSILLTLFPLVLRTVYTIVCRSQSHCLSGVVCILLMLLLSICWLGCTSSLSIIVSTCWLLLLMKLLLSNLHLWLLLWSSPCSPVIVVTHCPLVPCTPGTCISILRRYHILLWMLVVSFCICACWSILVLLYLLLVPLHLLLLVMPLLFPTLLK